MFLWPSGFRTCRMSFVLWYSIVAFQRRKVWNVIHASRGFLVLAAKSFLLLSKILAVVLRHVPPNTFVLVFGSAVNRSINLAETLTIRGLLCFSGLIHIVFFGCRFRFILSVKLLSILRLFLWVAAGASPTCAIRRTFKNAEKRVTSCEIEFTDKTLEHVRQGKLEGAYE